MNELNPRAQWAALAVLVLPVLMISMDATILGFAVPQLSEALEPSSSALLWIVDIYSFVLAGLLVTMGAIGDRIGRRRLLMFGAAAFTVASVLAAYSTSAPGLIGARAALGVAGATLLPSTLSLIRNIFTNERERQLAIAIWASTFAAGSAVGPIVGGFLLDHYWWGSVFLVGAPVTGALLFLAPRLVPESKDPNPGPFDLASSALSMATMLPAVYAVKTFAEHGLSISAFLAMTVGISCGIIFVRRQNQLKNPMIDMDLFRASRFRVAVSANLVACFGFAGSMFFVTQHLQLVVGMSAIRAGVHLLPAVAASMVFTLMAPALARRVGAFAVVTMGLVMGSVGFALFTQITAGGSITFTIVAVVILNAGLGATMTVSIDGILASVPPERAGAVSSVSETANELGIALGTAILGSIMTAIYRSQVSDLSGIPSEALAHARETLGAALGTAHRLGEPAGPKLIEAAQNAFVDGMNTAGLVAAILMAATAIWALRTHLSREVPTVQSSHLVD